MTTTFVRVVGTAAAVALAATIGMVASASQKTAATDKLYTKDQAAKAQEQFDQFCAKCHIPEKVPEGKKPGPPLTGEKFADSWRDRTVGELLENIFTTMPNDGSTTLTKEQTADLAALIFQMNKWPEGETPLKYDDPATKDVVVIK
jgi:mono/diheme cytochrome c family protein